MRYAVVSSNVVINIVEWDGKTTWSPPDGAMAFAADKVQLDIAWLWNDGAPVNPNPPPPPPAPSVPLTASAGDFVHALFDLGWLPNVKTAVGSVGGLAEELWNHSATYERKHPLVLQIAAAIGKTSDDLDMLFFKTLEYQ